MSTLWLSSKVTEKEAEALHQQLHAAWAPAVTFSWYVWRHPETGVTTVGFLPEGYRANEKEAKAWIEARLERMGFTGRAAKVTTREPWANYYKL